MSRTSSSGNSPASNTLLAQHLSLDLLDRGVPDVLAFDEVDDVLGDVLGVIADTLQAVETGAAQGLGEILEADARARRTAQTRVMALAA